MKRQPVTAATLDAIAKACEVPRKWLSLGKDCSVQFGPPPDAEYADVVCVIGEMRVRHVPIKEGFVVGGG